MLHLVEGGGHEHFVRLEILFAIAPELLDATTDMSHRGALFSVSHDARRVKNIVVLVSQTRVSLQAYSKGACCTGVVCDYKRQRHFSPKKSFAP